MGFSLSLSLHFSLFQPASLLLYPRFFCLYLHIKTISLVRYWAQNSLGSCCGCSGVPGSSRFCKYCLQLTAALSPECYLWSTGVALLHPHPEPPLKLHSSDPQPMTDMVTQNVSPFIKRGNHLYGATSSRVPCGVRLELDLGPNIILHLAPPPAPPPWFSHSPSLKAPPPHITGINLCLRFCL